MTAATSAALEHVLAGAPERVDTYTDADHWWALLIDVGTCIGCGTCVRACKAENDVINEPFYFRTWVERYHLEDGNLDHPIVDSPNGGYDGFPETYPDGPGTTFFVPKRCNHCTDSPSTQVCPADFPLSYDCSTCCGAVAFAMLVLGLAGCSSPDTEFPTASSVLDCPDLGGLQESTPCP